MKTTNSELQRYNLIGTSMKNWDECADDSGEFYVADVADAVIERLRQSNKRKRAKLKAIERSHIKQLQTMVDYAKSLEGRIARLEQMEKCPNCDDVGWWMAANTHTGEPEQVLCEFCYTNPNSKFNILNESPEQSTNAIVTDER